MQAAAKTAATINSPQTWVPTSAQLPRKSSPLHTGDGVDDGEEQRASLEWHRHEEDDDDEEEVAVGEALLSMSTARSSEFIIMPSSSSRAHPSTLLYLASTTTGTPCTRVGLRSVRHFQWQKVLSSRAVALLAWKQLASWAGCAMGERAGSAQDWWISKSKSQVGITVIKDVRVKLVAPQDSSKSSRRIEASLFSGPGIDNVAAEVTLSLDNNLPMEADLYDPAFGSCQHVLRDGSISAR